MRFGLLLAFSLTLGACGPAADSLPNAMPAAAAKGALVASDSKSLDSSSEAAMPDVGQPAPEFTFTMADGTTTKLSDLHGKKVIVNFWATWCEPCREEMPDLDQVRKEYGDSLVILGVNKAEKLGQVRTFTNDVPVGFMLVANPSGDISQRYGTRTVPNSFFINTDGTIGARELRIMDYATIKHNIDALR